MDTSMVERVQEKHWYLAVGDRSIGPLTTALVTRGIESGKVPLTAWICQVGADAWSALSSFGEFQDVVDRVLSADVPANQQGSAEYAQDVAPGSNPPVSSRAFETTASSSVGQTHGQELSPQLPYEVSEQAALPSFADELGDDEAPDEVADGELITSASLPLAMEEEPAAREELPSVDEQSGPREVPHDLRPTSESDSATNSSDFDAYAADASGFDAYGAAAAESIEHELNDELGIDITFEEDDPNSIDWNERFQSYFLVGTDVELPEETKLLQSLHETPRATFLHDEALWNLSLCLAFGSDEVAAKSARTFFEAIASDQASERIEWICRTLLSKGFMPSGIPRVEGKRGIEFLRTTCPIDLLEALEREAMD
ncbi:MAG TPA: hypothetical protein VIV60_29110 [Polyangiaceae bacterium]